MIDMTVFTPYSAAMGGMLIGIAAALFVLFDGRIAGISGIVGGLLRPRRGDIGWRLAFVVGLLASPWLYGWVAPRPEVIISAPLPLLVAAGFLVGIGTRYGAGCTSGHGVCGIARLSPRSLAATAIFMGAGFFATYVIRHWLLAE